ncbi:MAG: hypothetical protein KGQ77_11280 [Betaproteobacteria bacterium]|nr:hypothetical protein [Betaproteobacteria bacterium]
MDTLAVFTHRVPMVEVELDDPAGRQCFAVRVPGRTAGEGYAFLDHVAEGLGGGGARQLLMGTTFEPLRRLYAAHDAQIAALARQRLQALGPRPNAEELMEVARWASRERAKSARLWRIPTGPDIGAVLEARDWQRYGVGGRTLPNLMARNLRANPGMTTEQSLLQVIGSAGRTNTQVDLGVLRIGRALRTGGSILFVAGLGATAFEYAHTPSVQRAEFVRREAVGYAGAAVATGLATALIMTFALPGMVVVGVGVVAGVGGAWAAQQIYLATAGSAAQRQAHAGLVTAAALREARP